MFLQISQTNIIIIYFRQYYKLSQINIYLYLQKDQSKIQDYAPLQPFISQQQNLDNSVAQVFCVLLSFQLNYFSQMDQKVHKWDQKSSLHDMAIIDKQEQELKQGIRRMSKRNAGIQQPLQQVQISENFEVLQKKQQKTDITFIVMCLKLHFVFSTLSDVQLNHLAQQMFYCKLAKGSTIIKQGDSASSFFLLEKGKIQIQIDGVPRKELITGNGFGELALLYNAPRSATCVALEEAFLWGIDRHTFRKTVENIMRTDQEKNKKTLEKNKFFSQLTKDQRDSVSGVLISQKFAKDQVICNEGDQANSFYIITEGKVGVYAKDKLIRVLTQDESFGEQGLMNGNSKRGATVKAYEGDILGDGVQQIIYKNICRWAIQRSHLNIPQQGQLDKILDSFTMRRLKAKDQIITKGDPTGTLIILLESDAVDDNGNVVCVKGEILLPDTVEKQGKHDKTYYLSSEGYVAFMDFTIVRKQIGQQEQILQIYTQKYENISNQMKDQSLKDLIYLSKLGAGQFGVVYLCKYKQLDTLIALKLVSRAHIQQYGIHKHIQLERSVLQLMDHPFIMRFYRSYKDNENVYLLTEYIPGMELFDAIREIGLLSKNDSQFYISQMLLQMEYLHTQHKVIYRDIKPENLMVCDKGYLKLIDMGTAKPCASGQKTFTIIGTPHYMAPEVISGKGYNQMADLWSVGVCLFEFICGGLPFAEDAEDPFEIYKEIVKKPIQYPDYMSDKSAKVIIEQLMNKTAEMRLGGSYQSLKQNAWFKDFNWDALMSLKLKPPMIPNKTINPAQIQQLVGKGIPLLDQVQKDTANLKRVQAQPKDNEWDSEF
ncbi:hypothetical protein pb186bvf_006183 [Paramecium bursaria]